MLEIGESDVLLGSQEGFPKGRVPGCLIPLPDAGGGSGGRGCCGRFSAGLVAAAPASAPRLRPRPQGAAGHFSARGTRKVICDMKWWRLWPLAEGDGLAGRRWPGAEMDGSLAVLS